MVEKYVDEYSPAEPTERIAVAKRPRLSADAAAMIDIGGRFLICLIAIGLGIRVATGATSQWVAVLAAFACAAVIYALLSPTREG